MVKYKPWQHQKESIKFFSKTNRTLDSSDPGTGKTLAAIMSIEPQKGKTLVLCSKKMTAPERQDDIFKFRPELRVSSAYAKNRQAAFDLDADVYVTNIDAAVWLGTQTAKFFRPFDTLIIDESTAYKHKMSKRSRAVNRIKKFFSTRRLMTGTPHAGNISDLWNQIFILDDGAMFGKSFVNFRQQTMDSIQTGPQANMVRWENKPGIEEIVAAMIRPLNIRHKFSDCISIPENFMYMESYYMTAAQAKAYQIMKDQASVLIKSKQVTAVNAAAMITKLLQIASGAVYDENSKPNLVDVGRYELIIELLKPRDHTIVFFNWRHQREMLVQMAQKEGMSFGFIDGTVSERMRHQQVKDFQAGKTKVIFLQPQSAAHGITLTKANTTIWAGPTYLGDIFLQGIARMCRAGQIRKTETILIMAENTIEKNVYDRLEGKLSSIKLLQESLAT